MSTQISKFLSLVLRHEPARVGITLDSAGWTDVDALIAACAAHGVAFDRGELAAIVATSDKKRFALSADGTRIRANQGHSVEVDLALASVTPPDVLYHGTVERFLASIRARGLVRGGAAPRPSRRRPRDRAQAWRAARRAGRARGACGFDGGRWPRVLQVGQRRVAHRPRAGGVPRRAAAAVSHAGARCAGPSPGRCRRARIVAEIVKCGLCQLAFITCGDHPGEVPAARGRAA